MPNPTRLGVIAAALALGEPLDLREVSAMARTASYRQWWCEWVPASEQEPRRVSRQQTLANVTCVRFARRAMPVR
jgi:hypothetical protein